MRNVLSFLVIISACISWSVSEVSAAERPRKTSDKPGDTSEKLGFAQGAAPGEFTFNTGVVEGKLRAGGKSLGLTEVRDVASGIKYDHSNGLLSYYRVFTKNKRYGGGAWDWPSQATLLKDGSVEVVWLAAADRPFELKARYQWIQASVIDVTTEVQAKDALQDFEVFLASYFDVSFTNCAVYVRGPGQKPSFQPADKTFGDWQMYASSESYMPLIKDGRWKIEPNPVDWTVRPSLSAPLAWRQQANGLTGVLLGRERECFAVACPQQLDPHDSIYLSLFGKTIPAGGSASAKCRLVFLDDPKIPEILNELQRFLK